MQIQQLLVQKCIALWSFVLDFYSFFHLCNSLLHFQMCRWHGDRVVSTSASQHAGRAFIHSIPSSVFAFTAAAGGFRKLCRSPPSNSEKLAIFTFKLFYFSLSKGVEWRWTVMDYNDNSYEQKERKPQQKRSCNSRKMKGLWAIDFFHEFSKWGRLNDKHLSR